jgi:hypothetical protein
MNLLTTGNPKIEKGYKLGYMTAVLHLAPYTAAGVNVCPMAELAGCISACLNTAGRGGIAAGRATFTAPGGQTLPDNHIQRARIARTRFYLNDRAAFMAQLETEIAAVVRKANKLGLIPAVRLNGTSDIRWENSGIMAEFPDVQFYDYTKIPNRRNLPANYHLTWSYSARPGYAKYAERVDPAMPIAVVFRGKLPETFLGRPVIDGDDTDLRFLDPAGCVVGLKAKGAAKRDQSGFVV